MIKTKPKKHNISRLSPDLTTTTDLAKQLGMSLSRLYYLMDKQDIPSGDVIWGRKKVYSQQLVIDLTQKWKGKI
jgi:hypothetical protein